MALATRSGRDGSERAVYGVTTCSSASPGAAHVGRYLIRAYDMRMRAQHTPGGS